MAWKNVCPKPECNGRRFRNLEYLKAHMAEYHGGYSASEIAESAGADPATDPATDPTIEEASLPGFEPDAPRQERPRRATRQNRELNDKLNELLELQVRYLLGETIPPDQLETMKRNRSEVRNALVGFEFNFDDRVVKLESGFWRVVVTVLLIVLPFVPTLPDIKAKMDAMQRATQGKAPNAKGPQPVRPITPAPAPAPSPAPAPDASIAGAVDERTAFT